MGMLLVVLVMARYGVEQGLCIYQIVGLHRRHLADIRIYDAVVVAIDVSRRNNNFDLHVFWGFLLDQEIAIPD